MQLHWLISASWLVRIEHHIDHHMQALHIHHMQPLLITTCNRCTSCTRCTLITTWNRCTAPDTYMHSFMTLEFTDVHALAAAPCFEAHVHAAALSARTPGVDHMLSTWGHRRLNGAPPPRCTLVLCLSCFSIYLSRLSICISCGCNLRA